MKLGEKGLELIKKYEGLRLKAYKAVSTEIYYTIGYGHYGADVWEGMQITRKQAEEYLVSDCEFAVCAVNQYESCYCYNQNQFDALVSFTFNCGAQNFKRLVSGGARSLEQISNKIIEYDRAGGIAMKGLTRRRLEEQQLFHTPEEKEYCTIQQLAQENLDYSAVFDACYYADKYEDLRAAYGWESTLLFQHFLAYGMQEGRQAADTFNVWVYKKRYADLDRAFGDNMEAYYRHYLLFGRKEGRIAV